MLQVSHIGVMNNTSSTVLNFTNGVYSMRSCPKTQALSLKVLYRYISVYCLKAQVLSLKIFTIIFPYIVPKPKFYIYKVLPLYFRTLSRNPSFISISFYHYISVHCPKTQAWSLQSLSKSPKLSVLVTKYSAQHI